MKEIVVAGIGLHGGAPSRVAFGALPHDAGGASETTLNGAPLDAWRAIAAERSTLLTRDDEHVRTVEHVFAAAAARGLHRGLAIRVEGVEAPIADGCALHWLDVLAELDLPPWPPRLRIVREGTIAVGLSRYRFVPGEAVRVDVAITTGDPRVSDDASWDGTERDFRARIAPARTFCFASEVEELARRGLARHVPPEAVVVLGESVLTAGRPFEADEPPRHKLLDLLGDLFVYGGPPRGLVSAYRPGHWSTHCAVRDAIAAGILVRDTSA